jgi:hypothetical protein
MASVDVVVPCYQYSRFLRGCVASALNQDVDVRVLIIDNASTDDSLAVARDLAAEDDRIGVVAHPRNLGHLASFNEGIDWATADYFTVLCADDLLVPGCLPRATSVMDRHPDVSFTCGREISITSTDPIPVVDQRIREDQWRVMPGRKLLERFCGVGGCHISVSTLVVRTSAQKRAGYYRSELPHTADLEMWMRLARLGAVAETDAVQAIRRVHPVSRSASVTSLQWYLQFEAALESFFAQEGALLLQAKRLRRAARRSLGQEAYWSALATLLRGDRRLSIDLLRFAVSRCPTAAVLPPIGYLFQKRDAFSRMSGVISGVTRRIGASAGQSVGG